MLRIVSKTGILLCTRMTDVRTKLILRGFYPANFSCFKCTKGGVIRDDQLKASLADDSDATMKLEPGRHDCCMDLRTGALELDV